jgi:hypothetical protein
MCQLLYYCPTPSHHLFPNIIIGKSMIRVTVRKLMITQSVTYAYVTVCIFSSGILGGFSGKTPGEVPNDMVKRQQKTLTLEQYSNAAFLTVYS